MFQCTYFMFINLKGWGLCPNAEGGACVCVCGGGGGGGGGGGVGHPLCTWDLVS